MTGLSYETLKFYCKEGLVKDVKRDKNNYRIFDDYDIKWINSLNCLKACGMTISEMKEYLELCYQGDSTIPERKLILNKKRELLLEAMDKIQHSIDFIDWKENYYDNILSGKIKKEKNYISEFDN